MKNIITKMNFYNEELHLRNELANWKIRLRKAISPLNRKNKETGRKIWLRHTENRKKK